jgi:uncharacterized protein YfaA (DUF2138 family)
MPKAPVSVTLDTDNLHWLRGRMASRKRRSLSDALDEIVTAARTGASSLEPIRSVVGSVVIPVTDSDLSGADAYIRTEFAASLDRPLLVHEPKATFGATRRTGVRVATRQPRRG